MNKKFILLLLLITFITSNYTINWNGDPNLVSWPD